MDFSNLRIDISNPAPPYAADDPDACPDCQGAGMVTVMAVRMLGPEEFDNTPCRKVCGRCHGSGFNSDLPDEPDAPA